VSTRKAANRERIRHPRGFRRLVPLLWRGRRDPRRGGRRGHPRAGLRRVLQPVAPARHGRQRKSVRQRGAGRRFGVRRGRIVPIFDAFRVDCASWRLALRPKRPRRSPRTPRGSLHASAVSETLLLQVPAGGRWPFSATALPCGKTSIAQPRSCPLPTRRRKGWPGRFASRSPARQSPYPVVAPNRDMAPRAARDLLTLATLGRRLDDLDVPFQQLHTVGLDERVEGERGSGFSLAPAAMAAVNEQWP
jgi:hypothetical protein